MQIEGIMKNVCRHVGICREKYIPKMIIKNCEKGGKHRNEHDILTTPPYSKLKVQQAILKYAIELDLAGSAVTRILAFDVTGSLTVAPSV